MTKKWCRPRLRLLSLAVGLAFSSQVYAVPAGFEQLERPHPEIVDVVLFKQSLGQIEVRMSTESVQFARPAALLEQLKIKPEAKDKVLRWLSQPLPRNDALSCSVQYQKPGCGTLSPDKVQRAEVIYDDAESRLALFLPADVMQFDQDSNEKAPRYFSPATDAQSAFVHTQKMQMVQNDGDNSHSQSLSIFGNGALGLDPQSYVGLAWSANQTQGNNSDTHQSDVTDLYVRHDFDQRLYVQGGRMNSQDLYGVLGGSQSYTFLPIPVINGVRVGTSRSYLNRSSDYQATDLPVVLQNASRVDLYRGQQLLQSYGLAPGAYLLDASRLPDGSYPVTIKVFEGDRQVSEQTMAFTRRSGVQSGDSSAFDAFLQAGDMPSDQSVRDPNGQLQHSQVYQGGVRLPLGSWPVSLSLGGSLDSQASYVESHLDWEDNRDWGSINAQLTGFTGTTGVRGVGQNLSWSSPQGGLSFSLYHTQITTPSCRQVYSPMYSVNGCNDSLSFSANTMLGEWSLSTMLTRSHFNNAVGSLVPDYFWDDVTWNTVYTSNSNTNTNAQISATRSFNFGGVNLNASLGFTRTQSDNRDTANGVFLSLNASFLPSQTLASRGRASSTNAEYRYQGGNDSSGSNQLTVNHNESWLNGSYRAWNVSATGDDAGNASTTLSGDYNGQYGHGSASWQTNSSRGGSNSNGLSANYDSSFSVSSKGLTLGAANNGGSTVPAAVVLDLPKIGDEQFLMLQTDQSSYDISLGHQVTVPVDGYSMTNMKLSEANEAKVGNVSLGNGRAYQGFLLPGHVFTSSVQGNVSYTYIGRLLLDGQPLSNAILFGAATTISNEVGGFSLQMHTREASKLYAWKEDGDLYQCQVAGHKDRADVVFVGSLACQKADRASAPAEVLSKVEDWKRSAAVQPASVSAPEQDHPAS